MPLLSAINTIEKTRRIALLAGPPMLTAVCYWVTQAASTDTVQQAFVPQTVRQHVASTTDRDVNSNGVHFSSAPDATLVPTLGLRGLPPSIEDECQSEAFRLQQAFPQLTPPVVRPPFVISGNLPEQQLIRLCRDIVSPVATALQSTLQLQAPQHPVCLLVFDRTETFQDFTGNTAGRWYTRYYGYYLKPERRIVVNLEAGEGTLAHELTHVMLDADCPRLPEWLDEGLASLFEESEIRPDGREIRGLNNWRTAIVRSWCEPGRQVQVQDLLRNGRIRPQLENFDYALSRIICLYLQNAGQLAPYYRGVRDRIDHDPTGRQTLQTFLPNGSWMEFNRRLEAFARGG